MRLTTPLRMCSTSGAWQSLSELEAGSDFEAHLCDGFHHRVNRQIAAAKRVVKGDRHAVA